MTIVHRLGVVSIVAAAAMFGTKIWSHDATGHAPANWHDSFEFAKSIGRSQGKPVLLLQMCGKLDDAYC